MAIPMTRLGGRAFNHSPGNDVEAEYDRLRQQARHEGDKKRDCFDRSHQAYERGDGAGAKSLSNEGKRHASQQDALNKQASELIFRENNAPGRVADDTIDLHGQYVEEAEQILGARIREARARNQNHLHVIVGKGNHSAGHVQKIRPAVEDMCREMGIHCAVEENEGRIYVDLSGTGGGISAPPPLPQQPSGHQGGYGNAGYPGTQYGGHHGQQQQHHQKPHQQHHQQQQGYHQQQQYQGDQGAQAMDDLVPKVARKLLSCCVVM